ncbi:head decoration protein [uncultured Anaerovibrio sp.]|uniref:head decoration protein n=1 Tax=uncultured Anaerovibrio sp. TaxID=361586 RepID=UPI00261C5CAB|nr:head decoration protein [uncultured Anaerovibrio sp.]
MASLEKVTGVAYDELFAGPEIPVMTKNVTIKSGSTVVRGQLLSIDSDTGKVIPTPAAVEADAEKNIDAAPAGVAVYVAKETVDASTADKVATVYTSGYFNREKLVAVTGDTVSGHEAELRDVNIILSSLK